MAAIETFAESAAIVAVDAPDSSQSSVANIGPPNPAQTGKLSAERKHRRCTESALAASLNRIAYLDEAEQRADRRLLRSRALLLRAQAAAAEAVAQAEAIEAGGGGHGSSGGWIGGGGGSGVFIPGFGYAQRALSSASQLLGDSGGGRKRWRRRGGTHELASAAVGSEETVEAAAAISSCNIGCMPQLSSKWRDGMSLHTVGSEETASASAMAPEVDSGPAAILAAAASLRQAEAAAAAEARGVMAETFRLGKSVRLARVAATRRDVLATARAAHAGVVGGEAAARVARAAAAARGAARRREDFEARVAAEAAAAASAAARGAALAVVEASLLARVRLRAGDAAAAVACAGKGDGEQAPPMRAPPLLLPRVERDVAPRPVALASAIVGARAPPEAARQLHAVRPAAVGALAASWPTQPVASAATARRVTAGAAALGLRALTLLQPLQQLQASPLPADVLRAAERDVADAALAQSRARRASLAARARRLSNFAVTIPVNASQASLL